MDPVFLSRVGYGSSFFLSRVGNGSRFFLLRVGPEFGVFLKYPDPGPSHSGSVALGKRGENGFEFDKGRQ